MDPDNQVVRLCAAGMEAEQAGRPEDARQLFTRAWAARQNPYEACIAAHYVARHQEDAAGVLHWNQVALACADEAGDARVAHFYPSLYLNLGWSYEQLGDPVASGRYYDLAAEGVATLPVGPYRDLVEHGVTAGRARLAGDTLGVDPPPHPK